MEALQPVEMEGLAPLRAKLNNPEHSPQPKTPQRTPTCAPKRQDGEWPNRIKCVFMCFVCFARLAMCFLQGILNFGVPSDQLPASGCFSEAPSGHKRATTSRINFASSAVIAAACRMTAHSCNFCFSSNSFSRRRRSCSNFSSWSFSAVNQRAARDSSNSPKPVLLQLQRRDESKHPQPLAGSTPRHSPSSSRPAHSPRSPV